MTALRNPTEGKSCEGVGATGGGWFSVDDDGGDWGCERGQRCSTWHRVAGVLLTESGEVRLLSHAAELKNMHSRQVLAPLSVQHSHLHAPDTHEQGGQGPPYRPNKRKRKASAGDYNPVVDTRGQPVVDAWDEIELMCTAGLPHGYPDP